jgi:DNA primase
VILPIKQGAVVEGFIARSWEPNAKVPYLYPKGMRRAELFYGDLLFEAERARRVRAPHVLVEGAFDALSVWPYGLAVLGKPSQWQVKRLIEVGSTVAVCLDGDALDEGWSLALVLRVSGVRAGAVWLPPVTDPDEIPRQLLLDAARRCIDAPEPVRIER